MSKSRVLSINFSSICLLTWFVDCNNTVSNENLLVIDKSSVKYHRNLLYILYVRIKKRLKEMGESVSVWWWELWNDFSTPLLLGSHSAIWYFCYCIFPYFLLRTASLLLFLYVLIVVVGEVIFSLEYFLLWVIVFTCKQSLETAIFKLYCCCTYPFYFLLRLPIIN